MRYFNIKKFINWPLLLILKAKESQDIYRSLRLLFATTITTLVKTFCQSWCVRPYLFKYIDD